MAKINYSSYYTDGRVLGYVLAEEKEDRYGRPYYIISRRAYNRAENRCISGTRPNFHVGSDNYGAFDILIAD